MIVPKQSYIIACTPRSGSHFLADALAQTGIAGNPEERFPRPSEFVMPSTPSGRNALITAPPPEESYNADLDAEYVRRIIEIATTDNGVFGLALHRFQIDDAVRRINSYLRFNRALPPAEYARDDADASRHAALSAAFPNLSYIWLRRRDKVAQAVSWHKAVQSGNYITTHATAHTLPPKSKIEFNYTAIRMYWSALRSSDSSWQFYFSELKLEPHVVWYEDLTARYETSVKQILDYLKLGHCQHTIRPSRHKKVADDQSREWVEKFKRLQLQR